MSRKAVIAEIVDPGRCRDYRKGHRIRLTGFTPAGVCDSAYAVLSRDAQTLGYGGKLAWQKNSVVLTHCPDPEGALWRLQLDSVESKDEIGLTGPTSPRGLVDLQGFV